MNLAKKIMSAAGAVVGLMELAGGLQVSAAQPPVDLRCALRVNPLGIGPRRSWQLQRAPSLRGEVQTACQIQVGSTPGGADLWESGRVASSHVLTQLRPDAIYVLQAHGQTIASLRADKTGCMRFNNQNGYVVPQKFELALSPQ
jgi:hypothetical protein